MGHMGHMAPCAIQNLGETNHESVEFTLPRTHLICTSLFGSVDDVLRVPCKFTRCVWVCSFADAAMGGFGATARARAAGNWFTSRGILAESPSQGESGGRCADGVRSVEDALQRHLDLHQPVGDYG